jgi:hypothetical protein
MIRSRTALLAALSSILIFRFRSRGRKEVGIGRHDWWVKLGGPEAISG